MYPAARLRGLLMLLWRAFLVLHRLLALALLSFVHYRSNWDLFTVR